MLAYLFESGKLVVTFITNYLFDGRRRPVDSDVFLMIDFINHKIMII
jgi:hypothetical protein